MAYPDGFKYTKDHEWIDLTGDQGRVGITDYAQQQLGDVVYVELPEVGAKAGTVTSGTQTPHLKKAIGMAYLPVEHTAAGTEFEVDIRGKRARAAVVPMPFYKRPK